MKPLGTIEVHTWTDYRSVGQIKRKETDQGKRVCTHIDMMQNCGTKINNRFMHSNVCNNFISAIMYLVAIMKSQCVSVVK